MRSLLPIGRFSQITRLTHKALRIYDDMGLLQPAEVDSSSGYRYYGVEQVAVASRIRLLRSLEMPLEEIRLVIDETDPQIVRTFVERHRQRVEERIAAYRRALVFLDRLARTAEVTPYEVKVKLVVARPILTIHAATSLADMDVTMPFAIEELYTYLEHRGIPAAGPDFCAYSYPEGCTDPFTADACVPVESRFEGEGRVVAGTLPAGPVAYTVHIGPYEELHLAFEAVLTWIHERGRLADPLRAEPALVTSRPAPVAPMTTCSDRTGHQEKHTRRIT